MTVSLVTCVTNAGGMGPGHSCIDINGTIYSFQGLDYGGNNSAWVQSARSKYLGENAHRPVIFQRLSSAVADGKVLLYILASIADDDDYATSGVCSSQAANAIEAGYASNFNTWGLDTPYDIYDLAKKKNMVSSESFHWSGESSCNFMVRGSITATLVYMGAGQHV